MISVATFLSLTEHEFKLIGSSDPIGEIPYFLHGYYPLFWQLFAELFHSFSMVLSGFTLFAVVFWFFLSAKLI